MSQYKLKTPKQAKAAVGAYKKTEQFAVDGYKAIEKRFVDAFLEKTEEAGQTGEGSPTGTCERFNMMETKSKQSTNNPRV